LLFDAHPSADRHEKRDSPKTGGGSNVEATDKAGETSARSRLTDGTSDQPACGLSPATQANFTKCNIFTWSYRRHSRSPNQVGGASDRTVHASQAGAREKSRPPPSPPNRFFRPHATIPIVMPFLGAATRPRSCGGPSGPGDVLLPCSQNYISDDSMLGFKSSIMAKGKLHPPVVGGDLRPLSG
jgi:hypothetical protein